MLLVLVLLPKSLYDKVDNGCRITVRVANHNAEDANVTLKSVVDGNEVSTQVALLVQPKYKTYFYVGLSKIGQPLF